MSPVKLVRPRRFDDGRGGFAETYNSERYSKLGIETKFVQDNHSLSRPPFVIRGLHFQTPPRTQAKLVRCVRGRIWDVAVDVRRGSPTYGRWVGAELSPDNGDQLFVPMGFAHGFLTLEPETEVEYKVSDVYAPECDAGLRWDDPVLAIDWPLQGRRPILSDKDTALPLFADFDSPFDYEDAPLEPLQSAPLTP